MGHSNGRAGQYCYRKIQTGHVERIEGSIIITKQPLALLNTTIATTDGTYCIQTISLNEAIILAKLCVTGSSSDLPGEFKFLLSVLLQIYELDGYISAIGHHSTAQIMSDVLGVNVPVDRIEFKQKVGQTALVFKLNGRPPENKVFSRQEIEAMGYTFKLMTRTT